jgi:hypothetical protein
MEARNILIARRMLRDLAGLFPKRFVISLLGA